jgi:hypothetical protein
MILKIFISISFFFVSFFSLLYCDMTFESQNSPLLDNGSVITFPLQRIDAVTDVLLEVVMSLWFTSSYERESVSEFKDSLASSVRSSIIQL